MRSSFSRIPIRSKIGTSAWGLNFQGRLTTALASRSIVHTAFEKEDISWIRHAKEIPDDQSKSRVAAYSTALEYTWTTKFEAEKLSKLIGSPLKVYNRRDLLHISDEKGMDIFFFTFGSFVAWGTEEKQEQEILRFISDTPGFQKGAEITRSPQKDRYFYLYGKEAEFSSDYIIFQEKENPMANKLAASFGLAQGITIQKMEEETSRAIQTVERIGLDLAKHGTIKVSKRVIEKQYGELLLYMTHSLLNDLLDKPDFLWDIPESEYLYDIIATKLDVTSRMELLNTRHTAIGSCYTLVKDHFDQKYGHRLEWLIIALISVEVVFGSIDFFDLAL